METRLNPIKPALKIMILIMSIFICAFHLFITLSISVSVMQQRVIHLFSLMALWYFYKAAKDDARTWNIVLDLVLCLAVIALGIYFIVGTGMEQLMEKGIWGISLADTICGVILIVLILEVSRESIGLALPIIAIVFLVYALAGPYLPNLIAHRGYDLEYITSYVAWTGEGIFGTPIGASVSFVVLYIIFGELLDKFGAGKFFIDISYALTGRMRGGPAEASVLSSALMGSINGSAVANVVTTGTFTIPLMKKVGYKKEYAGAVEAVASTGGQILPPVMGAAAFVMADMTGIPYSTIIIAALIPGILYYVSLGLAVYFEAGRLGIQPESSDKIMKASKALKEGWFHLIPLAVLLICLLGFGFSASYSAIFAIIAVLLIGIFRTVKNEHRFPWAELRDVSLHAAKSSIAVAIACASAGIVIGIVSMTGLGVRFTQIVIEVANGRMLPMLIMTMVACIILGMGLPSTAAYVIAATVCAPALIQGGVSTMAANLFVFYFAIISFITPPVALAAYAAAGLAEADAMRTGLKAFMLGIAGFIIPFLFIYYPGLIIVDSTFPEVLVALFVAICAVVMMALFFEGWCGTRMNWPLRAVCFIAAVMMILPYSLCDIIGGTISVAMVIYLLVKYRKTKQRS